METATDGGQQKNTDFTFIHPTIGLHCNYREAVQNIPRCCFIGASLLLSAEEYMKPRQQAIASYILTPAILKMSPSEGWRCAEIHQELYNPIILSGGCVRARVCV